jgi:hypothetical protein
MKTDSAPNKKTQLTVILLVYLILAAIFGFAYKYAMNPDGISLLRLAGYISEGHFYQSVTSTWSPLVTWIIAPFLYIGFDGLTAARIAIALCGAGLLLCSWLLALRFNLSHNMRFISVLIAAVLISFWTIQFITADVLFALLIVFLFYLITDQHILERRKNSVYCGIVGGLSYLAHHYALPFFMVYFPMQLVLRGYLAGGVKMFPWRKVFISWGSGMAGFLMITILWVGVISSKYGHFTVSSKGNIAHSRMGPSDVDRKFPYFVGGLNKPENAYAIHIFEDPSGLKFNTWSPLESKEYFFHQLKVIKINVNYILNHFVTQSPFFTYPFVTGTLVVMLIAIILSPQNNQKRYLYLWIITTFIIYCSGYVLIIARSPRRFYALMIVFLLLSFHSLEELKKSVSDIIIERRKKVFMSFLILIVVSAFSLKPGMQVLRSAGIIIAGERVNPYSEIAERINTYEFPSPYAIIRSSQKHHTDYYIAYFLGKQFLGRPLSRDIDGITGELIAADAKSLLVFDNHEIEMKLNEDRRYMNVGSLRLQNYDKHLNPINAQVDQISDWDSKVNIYVLR